MPPVPPVGVPTVVVVPPVVGPVGGLAAAVVPAGGLGATVGPTGGLGATVGPTGGLGATVGPTGGLGGGGPGLAVLPPLPGPSSVSGGLLAIESCVRAHSSSSLIRCSISARLSGL